MYTLYLNVNNVHQNVNHSYTVTGCNIPTAIETLVFFRVTSRAAAPNMDCLDLGAGLLSCAFQVALVAVSLAVRAAYRPVLSCTDTSIMDRQYSGK